MYVLVGFVTLVVSLLVSVMAAYLPARWAAQRIGLGSFRIFDVSHSGQFAKIVAVRLVSILGPLLLLCVTFAGSLLVRGEPVAKNLVNVVPGPAMAAGVQNGDRIVSVNGVATPEFEAIRREVRNGNPSLQVTLERAGSRRTVTVVPDETGAVKVVAAMERRTVGAGEAVVKAVRLVGQFASAILGSKRAELAGPVAVVKSVGLGARTSWWDSSLHIASYLGCSVAFMVLVLHLFDGLTYGWYRVSLRVKDSARHAGALGRRRQALGIALLLGALGLAAVTAFEAAEINLGFFVEFVSKVLVTLAIPLAWLIVRELYGERRALGFTLLFFVPVLNVVLPLVIWVVAGKRLAGSG